MGYQNKNVIHPSKTEAAKEAKRNKEQIGKIEIK